VVEVEPADTAPWQTEHGVLAGIALQKGLEQSAKRAGGGGQKAPAQSLIDFLEGRESGAMPATSYFPGVTSAPLEELAPPFIGAALRQGLRRFVRAMPRFHSEEAILLGFETRSSSPVRVPRSEATLEHPEVAGLFPCGEGAGYAGGIVSAALDGMRCAEAVAGRA
jgi:uncharacterized FAD-dependent dehydrogenase